MRTIGPGQSVKSRPPTVLDLGLRRGLRTILLMKFLDFKSELAFLHDLVIELMPSAHRCIFGPWEVGERVKVKAINNETQEINKVHKKCAC